MTKHINFALIGMVKYGITWAEHITTMLCQLFYAKLDVSKNWIKY